MRAVLIVAALAACSPGYDPGGPEIADAYHTDDPIPFITNDGFYDGGVFDQDMLDLEPNRPN